MVYTEHLEHQRHKVRARLVSSRSPPILGGYFLLKVFPNPLYRLTAPLHPQPNPGVPTAANTSLVALQRICAHSYFYHCCPHNSTDRVLMIPVPICNMGQSHRQLGQTTGEAVTSWYCGYLGKNLLPVSGSAPSPLQLSDTVHISNPPREPQVSCAGKEP